MPENEPGFARAAGVPDEARGPLWDEVASLSDEERRGPLWESSSGDRAAELSAGDASSTPAGEATAAEPAPVEPAAAAPPPTAAESGPALQAAPEPVPAEPASPPAAAFERPHSPDDVSPAATASAASADGDLAAAPRPVEAGPATPSVDAPLEPATAAASPEPGEMAAASPTSDRPAAEATVPRYTPEVVGEGKDPNTAFLLELIPGLFGFLGIGYLYVGRTNDGIIRLAAFLIYNLIAWIAIFALSLVIVGLCLIPFQLAIQIGVPIWSALQLRKELDAVSVRAGAGF
jgi:TM2 domain-containing membrane protein YozV